MALILDGTNGLFGDVTGGDISGNFIIDSVNLQDGSVTEAKLDINLFNAITDGTKYLGGFAVAPTLNNQGLPLVSGNLYWNTVSNNLWAHNGTNWVVTNFNETTPFLATGTTTARNLVTRMADVVNVKDFGAVGNLIADDTAAIQAAIDYAAPFGRRAVYFPPGNYLTTSPLYVRSSTHIMGCGRSVSLIMANHNGDGIVFEPTGAGSLDVFLSNCKISSISVSRNTAGNGGSAVWVRQCNQFTAEDVGVSNKNFGFRITGGQLNLFNNIRAAYFSPFTQVLPPDLGACFLFEQADLGGGNFQPCYTVSINNVTATTGNLLPQIIRIHSVDGLNINNCYFAFAWSSLMRFARQSIEDQITAVNINNCYFDAVDNIRDGVVVVPKCVHIRNDLGSFHEGCRQTRFTNCFFANNDGLGEYLVTVQKFCELQFSNCSFGNSSAEGFSVSDGNNVGVAKGRYLLNGCLFKNLSELDPSGFSLYIKDAEYVTITGCTFYNTITPNSHIRLTGSLVSGCVIGNSGDPSTTTLTTSGLTVSDKLIAINTGDPKVLLGLPTSSVGLPSGAMWNNAGNVQIVP